MVRDTSRRVGLRRPRTVGNKSGELGHTSRILRERGIEDGHVHGCDPAIGFGFAGPDFTVALEVPVLMRFGHTRVTFNSRQGDLPRAQFL